MRGAALVLLCSLSASLAMADPTHILGRTLYANGDPISGVTVTMTGAGNGTTTSNIDGVFKFQPVQYGVTYVVTPTKAGCTFSPTSQSVLISTVESHADFTGVCGAPVVTLISPQNGATVDPTTPAILTWTAPSATSYDVYMGTSNPPVTRVGSALPTEILEVTVNPSTTYYWKVVATNEVGSAESAVWSFQTSAGPLPPGLRFVPLSPCRVVDTRPEEGKTGPFGPGSTLPSGMLDGITSRDFPIATPEANCQIPITAKAVSANVTVVPEAALGYLTLWQTGKAQPVVSTLNSHDGRVVANAAIIPVGTDGSVSAFASNPGHLIIDINGYFEDQAVGNAFYLVDPCRYIDTRIAPTIAGGGMIEGWTDRTFAIAGACGLPAAASRAAAYALNITAVPDVMLGFLTAWPTGIAKPWVSTLNSHDGNPAANFAIVPSGDPTGSIDIFPSNSSDVIVDTNGYFAPVGGTNPLLYRPIAPCRAVDTRIGVGDSAGLVTASSVRSYDLPALTKCGETVPASAKAYAVNVTVQPTGPLGYATLYPAGMATPGTSTLNSMTGQVQAAAAVVGAGSNGQISVFVSNDTHVIVDVVGYFEQ